MIRASANVMNRPSLLSDMARHAVAEEQCPERCAQAPVECSSTRPLIEGKLRESEGLPVAEAIRRAQQGDEAAFERLYRLHCQRVYAVCLRMVRNTAEAEELTQAAFLQVFRKIATFRGGSAFSTWLHRVVVNIVLMRLRRKRNVTTLLNDAGGPNEEGEAPHREIGGPDPLVAGALDRVDLERAIEQLPKGYKTVVVLHDIQGYEHSEIATIMDCTIGNSKSQLHKARMRLRALLREPTPGKAGTAWRVAAAQVFDRTEIKPVEFKSEGRSNL